MQTYHDIIYKMYEEFDIRIKKKWWTLQHTACAEYRIRHVVRRNGVCLCFRGREVQMVLPQWVHVVSQGSRGSEESQLVSHLSPGCSSRSTELLVELKNYSSALNSLVLVSSLDTDFIALTFKFAWPWKLVIKNDNHILIKLFWMFGSNKSLLLIQPFFDFAFSSCAAPGLSLMN